MRSKTYPVTSTLMKSQKVMEKQKNASNTKLVKLDETTASISTTECSIEDHDNITMDTALELHLACANGASQEQINSILLRLANKPRGPQGPEVTYVRNDVTDQESSHSHFGKSEEQTALHKREMRHASMVTNFSVEANGESKYRRQPLDSQHNSVCLFDCDEKKNNLSQNMASQTSQINCLQGEEEFRLTYDALSRRNEYSRSLLKIRHKLWTMHSKTFIELKREIKEISKEKDKVLKEIKIINDAMQNLQERFVKESQLHDECKKTFIERVKTELRWKRPCKPNSLNFEYNIGLAAMNKNDLERYCYELEERLVVLKNKYESLFQSIFGEIDRRIELTLCVRIQDPRSSLQL